MSGLIVVDVVPIKQGTDQSIHVKVSREVWEAQGFELVTDEDGPDVMLAYKSSIASGQYDQGDPIFPAQANAVILVYQRK